MQVNPTNPLIYNPPTNPLIYNPPNGNQGQGNIVINLNQLPIQNQPLVQEPEPNFNPEIEENDDIGDNDHENQEIEENVGDNDNENPDMEETDHVGDNEIENSENEIENQEMKQPEIKYVDDDFLSKNLNLYIDTDKIPIYNISFCIYIINTECFIEGIQGENDSILFHDTKYLYNNIQPFLQFVLEKKETSFEFPSTTYECPRFSSDETDEKSQEQIHFETFCFSYLSTFLDYPNEMDVFHKEKIDIQGIYKGFIQDT